MGITRIFYPDRCPVCEEIISFMPDTAGRNICEKCNAKLHYIMSPRCLKCGKQIYSANEEFCSDCANKTHYFKQGIGVFGYDEHIRESIYRFKYSNQRRYASFYADAIARRYGQQIKRWNIDAIIPVPMYKLKQYQRGYNQAQLIAAELGKILKIQVESDILIRTRRTRPMKELNDQERNKNLQNAFKISENIVKYKRILLVDDIYTTGATIDACSSELLDVGVSEVYFACVCIGNGF